MKCRIDEDDRCIAHWTPVEHMAYCPHDGAKAKGESA